MNTQVKQLKLNVTNIKSILVKTNEEKEKTKKIKNQNKLRLESIRKKEEKEKTIEFSSPNTSIKSIASRINKVGGNIFDKLLNFGSLLLLGILANSLPAIAKKIVEVVDDLVNFLTPLYSGFILLQKSFNGEPLDDPELNPEKKRFADQLKKAKIEVDKLKENLGIGGFIINPLQNFINGMIEDFGGDRLVMATKTEIDEETGEKKVIEGFLDNESKIFIERPFTSAERETYYEKRRGGNAGISGTDSTFADSPDLKTAIRRAESGNNYGATFKGYLDGFSRKNEDLTNMSINQVVQYQKDYIAHQRKLGIPETQRSAAVGAYQMLFPELAASKTGVPLTAKFNKKNQDRMADYYLNMAGYQQFIKGKISAEQFNNRLAGQFASLKTTSGSGVYDKDGINKAYEDLLDLIKKSRPAEPRASIQPIQNREVASVISQSSDDGEGLIAIQPIIKNNYIAVS
jgi:muramidase (phage lysozyme)